MKVSILVISLLASCGGGDDVSDQSSQNGQYDFWVSIEKAQEKALDDGKYIVLDVYAEWCGFCRRMNLETYADQRVQDALDRYFHPVRINSESERKVTFLNEDYTQRELAMNFGVNTLPTTIFISPEGEPIAAQPGFIDADIFHRMLSYVGTESYQNVSFQQYTDSN
ncbi:MAG: thioredoxin fold domain-containing protein [Balneolales bacterium]